MVGCMIKRNGWTRKKALHYSSQASQELQVVYLTNMAQFDAEDLVFLNESIFNEKTG
jgi:hypothetical protein